MADLKSGSGTLAISLALVLVSLGKEGCCLNMLTGPQLYNAAVGETVRLSCEFRASHFDLFSNPLLWIKTQKGEDTQINIQSNINPPFRKTKRFKVKYIPMEPIYRFELTIAELSRADNGNYTCQVRAENSKVLANITHLVIVRAPVESMFVSDNNRTAAFSLPELVYTSTQPATLRCMAEGAFPAPDLQLSVANMDVGSRLAWKYTPLFEGPKGLRRMSYTVERWSYEFYARPEYDGKEMRCAAFVPGLTVHTTTVKIRVRYPPIIRCHDVSALLGQRNVSLTCIVTSRPRVPAVRWYREVNGTRFNVMLSTAFWTSQKVLNSTTLSATLHLSQSGPTRFTTYNVLAKNTVGESTQKVELIRSYNVPTQSQPPQDLTTMKTARYGESGSHYIFIISGTSGMHALTFQHVGALLLAAFYTSIHCACLNLPYKILDVER